MNIVGRSVRILLVEDNPGDIRLIQEALNEGNKDCVLSVVKDGIEAVSFMRQDGMYAEAMRPDIILLDLNLPKKDGREVLGEIKGDPNLRRIPVVVFTGSESEEDVCKAYDMYANCYVVKSAGLDGFIKLVKEVEDFWLTIASLPPS
jgi:chemotaxis family two-component system response regulator Rcp1